MAAKTDGPLKLDVICARLQTSVPESRGDENSLSNEWNESSQLNHGATSYDGTDQLKMHLNSTSVGEANNNILPHGAYRQSGNFTKSDEKAVLETGGSGRKNKRKSQNPRSISHYVAQSKMANEDDLDDLDDEYDLHTEHIEGVSGAVDLGQDTAAAETGKPVEPIDDTEDAVLDLSCSARKAAQEADSGDVEYKTDELGVMDLSSHASPTTHSQPKLSDHIKKQGETGQAPVASSELGRILTTEAVSRVRGGVQGEMGGHAGVRRAVMAPVDASTMKNYAENTMQELLNLYGYSDEPGTASLTDNVPLHNFLPGSILDGNVKMSPSSRARARVSESGTRHQVPLSAFQAAIDSSTQSVSIASKDGNNNHGNTEDNPSIEFHETDNDTAQPTRHIPVFDNQVQISPSGTVSSRSRLPTSGFASSAAYVKACFDPSLAPKLASVGNTSPNKGLLPDYSKYVKRYTSYEDCGGNHCQDMGYKEHFHCVDCSFRVFVKKEEMIRHFKWHKKRDESLQHGFLRFSPTDDCTKKFGVCTHNGRQTHYHCLQNGCSKVYISTSDVQMHANYHRKDSAIIQEGFQRFRATEDCGSQVCAFYGQRTTHFHCRREGCSFTFKNKADMEKHKTYHQKDEILSKDGFKKFMKYEHCNFTECRYSKVSNHIHCIRAGCNYVLHSTGQLYSHKRKHERRDFEHAYKRYRDEHKVKPVTNTQGQHFPQEKHIQHAPRIHDAAKTSALPNHRQLPISGNTKEKEYVDIGDLPRLQGYDAGDLMAVGGYDQPADLSIYKTPKRTFSYEESDGEADDREPYVKREKMEYERDEAKDLSFSPSADMTPNHSRPSSMLLPVIKQEPAAAGSSCSSPPIGNNAGGEESLQEEAASPTDPDMRPPTPQMAVCNTGFVPSVTPAVNEKRERDESWKKYLTRYTANDPCHSRCQFLYKDHYHCNTAACGLLFRAKDGVREHAKHHEQQDRVTSCSYVTYEAGAVCQDGCKYNEGPLHYHCVWNNCREVILASDQYFSRLEHHKIHEYARVAAGTARKAIPTQHFKLPTDNARKRRGRPPKYPRTEIPLVPKIEMTEKEIEMDASISMPHHPIAFGFRKFVFNEPCPDDKCLYYMREHYHCVRNRCHHSTDRSDVLNLHAKDFHSYVTILEGFEFFDRNINCRRPHCHNNRANRHFHCVRAKCDYSFVRYSTMAQHDKKHKMAEMGLTPSPTIAIPKSAIQSKPPSTAPVAIAPQPLDVSMVPLSMASGFGSTAQTSRPMIPIIGQPPQGTVMVGPSTMAMSNAGQVLFALPQGSNNAALPGSQILLQVTSPSTLATTTAPVVTITPKLTMDGQQSQATMLPSNQQHSASLATASSAGAVTQSPALPLTMLLQQRAASLPQLNWLAMEMKMHFGNHQICGRPFCKLKKKDHYHCFECNQAFSDPARLKSHVGKHGIKVDKTDSSQQVMMSQMVPELAPLSPTENSDETPVEDDESSSSSSCHGDTLNASSSLNLNANAFSTMFNQQMLHDEPACESDPNDHDLVIDLSRSNSQASESAADEYENDFSLECDKNEDDDDLMQDMGQDLSAHGVDADAEDAASARRSHRKRTATKHDGFVNSDIAVAKMKSVSRSNTNQHGLYVTPKPESVVAFPLAAEDAVTSHGMLLPVSGAPTTSLKLVQVPEGYQQYKLDEDCSTDRCPFKNSTSHFHCVRKNCGYPFSDEAKFIQHNELHRKLEELMGDDFEQYLANIDCHRPDCEFTKQGKHFHCLRCPFICTDSNKVAAHRKQHFKMDNIKAQGFTKCSLGENCGYERCNYSTKTTHYHCIQGNCGQVAMGPAQMSAHKVRHSNGKLNN